jgi:hypothetical protein
MKTNIHFCLYLAEFFLEREMFRTKLVGKIETHTLCALAFYPENHVVYAIMWKSVVEPDRTQMAVWRMRVACWVTMATHTPNM